MSSKSEKDREGQARATSVHGPELQQILTDQGSIGLSIFEKDAPPRFRLTGLNHGAFKVETKRAEGGGEEYRFVDRGNYWESIDEIPEPHEFEVLLTIGDGADARSHTASFDEHGHSHDHHGIDGPPPEPPPGPIAQSVAIGFRAVYAVTLVLAALWLASNIRQIAPDSQAIVMRFDRIVRVQDSGLLLAWPRPIEQVVLVPGPERQLSQAVGALPPVGGITQTPPDNALAVGSIPATASAYLTGDGNVVFLDAKLVYRITDPRAYVLSQEHVLPGLDRLFRATAVRVTAGWGLNDFVVAQPAAAGGGQAIVALRTAVRDDLLSQMNSKLQELSTEGVGFGVEVAQIDMTAWLPPEAKIAFDAVLTATQAADQQVAAARTAAELRRQGAQREGDRITSASEATASERITTATVDTAAIKALVAEETQQTRESLMLRAYNEKIAEIMNRAGSVTLVDPQSGARFVLPGKQP